MKLKKDMKSKTFKEESELILKGLERAYEKMVKFKKEKGSPLVVFENGKIKKIPAKEILPTAVYLKA